METETWTIKKNPLKTLGTKQKKGLINLKCDPAEESQCLSP